MLKSVGFKLYEDGESIMAQGIEHDILVQGTDEDDVLHKIENTILAELDHFGRLPERWNGVDDIPEYQIWEFAYGTDSEGFWYVISG